MNLQVLEASSLSNIVQDSERFIMAIRNHGHLRELRTESAVSVHCTIVRHLLFSCGNLGQLHLQFYIHGYHIAATPEQDMQDLLEITGSKATSFKLKEQNFPCRQVIAGYILLPFLRLCSKLEQFTTPQHFTQSGYPAIASVIPSITIQLQHLNMRETKTSGSNVRDLIDACVGPRAYRGAFFQQQVKYVFEALFKHRVTLEALDLERWGSDNSTSGMGLGTTLSVPEAGTEESYPVSW